ncbi:MAG: excinuclease ABC subunit UvrC [Bacteroidaceae bacterium]|nr:excinuclease ABC subunit UvrC [Bacteroidaceae bacterium]
MTKKKENETRLQQLKNIVASLPEKPGSYQYYDAEGTIIYVGKAKNLKRRVSSYFNKEQQSAKTTMLVSKIHNIKYIVVNTEEDALLLENNLIKQYKPKYNVLLKDDKTYPSICITKEDYPRIYKTRQINLKHGQYFGPYSHVGTMYTLLDLIKAMYFPRPCMMPMNETGVKEGKYEICLNYQIKKCKAPCIGKQSREEYNENIDECREILKGNTDNVLNKMKQRMEELAGMMRFEEAQIIKERFDMLRSFQAKSEIVHPSNTNLDVFNIETDEKNAFINYLHVIRGSITQAFTFEYKKKMDESPAELLTLGIVEMRERFHSKSKEIVVPFEIDLPLQDIIMTVPQRGDKRKLLDLSGLNVKQYKFDRLKQAEKLNPEQKSVRLMKEIQQHLHLPKLPIRVELFDNSNIQGSDAVAACVVFEKLKPAKKLYRKYIIKTVEGPDDYASMQEVVRRRYTRMAEEDQPMPDLIITDGGKGQMECVRKVVEDELHLEIPIAGLAKDNRHRTNELLYGSPPIVIGMKQNSELFHLLTRMQDEVHRFAITFHRQKRAKSQLHSALDDIPGVGKTTKELLIKRFKSLKRIKEAPEQALQEVIGNKRGSALYAALHPFIELTEKTE